MAHIIETDYYANRPYAYETEYVRDPSLTILRELQQRFPKLQIESTLKPNEYKMISVMGTEFKFYIDSNVDKSGYFMHYSSYNYKFGWNHEGYLQTRSWHYICKDIYHYYSSGY